MHIHVLSFTIPYPPDYGGVIDVFEKIRALQAEGVRVHLHCYQYNRERAEALEEYCEKVYYYQRKVGLSLTLPHIVASRRHALLATRLDRDDYPILAEGVHTAYPLVQGWWPGRKVAVRLHNVETEYYRNLSEVTHDRWKSMYYGIESGLLRRWEERVAALPLLAIHPGVKAYYEDVFGAREVTYLPAFTRYVAGDNPLGRGEYVLFHGDLSVADNVEALRWLLEEVRGEGRLPWVVAGRQPDERVFRLIRGHAGVRLYDNPSAPDMEALIRGAQVHVVQSFNPEGIKIKLLHALFAGRHCIAQEALLAGTGLSETCRAAGGAAEFRAALDELWERPFTEEDRALRTRLLREQFDNGTNARALMAALR
ncbi:MAG TPA: glycosyltransferase [Dinghuibacter sp.]|jgi:hypothetical protein|uniref:glycosyltransferase n=1 Tax=Dinghuibacter sp. TaxID=2024697 RepID=UPI002C505604|nr:glycosyltransferase [Dinghuibacter sp.]HTJ12251.1 glycosyltransferase [Dinghuibacter sp.]